MKFKVIFLIIILNVICYGQNNISKENVRFMAVGDINIAHWITPILDTQGENYPFKYVNDLLSAGDLIFANLEAPFCEKGEAYPKNFVFNVPARHVNTLKSGNINLVSLANNHILDYGMPGLISTIKALKKAKIFFAGAGTNFKNAYSPALFEINNLKIAFFAYSMTLPKYFFATDTTGGTAYPYIRIMRDSISQYKKSVDVVVVSFHWGKELSSYPEEYQIKFAHLAINYGADIILGHHPHVLQGIENYKGKYIFYSLGNFVFASYSDKATESIILDALLTKNGVERIQVSPINVNNYEVHFRPKILTAERKTKVINHLREISLELNDSLKVINSDGNLNQID